ncbi:MAG: NAD(P)-dependent oxidoreductase [Pedosphaera sp.]|nr:NAD(P)-dependent oxidoreductase [Pedosphaera sp.]
MMNSAEPVAPSVIGIIGLGLMGSALACRLRQGGFTVRGFDTDAQCVAAFVALGGEMAGDANAVLGACEVVLLSLPDHREVRAVLAEGVAHLRAGQIVVDTTTGDPDAAVESARQLAARGVFYLDATLSGSSAQAREGDVICMAGGEHEAFERCAELFRCVAREVVHTGAAGSGSKMKLVTNLVLGLNRAALAEGLALAGALDLDLAQTLAVLLKSAAYSRIMDTKGDKMISGDFTPVARLSQHLKDVRLMLAATPLALPLSETHRELLEKAVALGYGEFDNSAVIKAIQGASA